MPEEVELVFRGVHLGKVSLEGTTAAHESPLPVGTEVILGGRAARVVRAVEHGQEPGQPAGMRVVFEDAPGSDSESEEDGGAAESDAGGEGGKASEQEPRKKRKRRR